MTYWLIQPETLAAMKEAAKTVSAETIAAYSAEAADIMSISNGEAVIYVTGTLTNRPSYIARYFGGGNTTYQDIIGAIASAESDPRVSRIVLMIDSPGGQLTGFFKAMDAIYQAKKPVKAIALNMAASAAFGIGSQALNGFYAENRATGLGSVGVAYDTYVWPEDVSITSTDAPEKRPDLTTPEGKAIIQKELDAYHALFAEAIARGRGVTVEKVNSGFGRGGMLIAGDAVAAGMIDGILEKPVKERKKAMSDDTIKTVKELKTVYPELCEQIAAEGVASERDRVTAHLTMGEQSGDMKTAITAINDGSGMTQALTAKYLTAGMNKRDQDNRSDDDAAAAAATNGADPAAAEDENKVMNLVAERLGK